MPSTARRRELIHQRPQILARNRCRRRFRQISREKVKLCVRTGIDVLLCGFQDGQHGPGTSEVEQPAAVGNDMLVVAGAGVEEVALLIVTSDRTQPRLLQPEQGPSLVKSKMVEAARHHACFRLLTI